MFRTRSLRWLLPAFAAVSTFTSSSIAQSFEVLQPFGTSTSGLSWVTVANGSADGTAIIGTTSVTGLSQVAPFIWRSDTGMFLLTNSAGNPLSSNPIDVANGGNRAVLADGGTTADPGRRALLWTRTNGVQSIGRLPGEHEKFVEPKAISGDGKVIVGRAKSANTPDFRTWEAFHWTVETGIVGLGDIIGDPQLDEYGSQAVGVSADGKIIAGTVRYGGELVGGVPLHAYYAPGRWVNGAAPEMLPPPPHGAVDAFGALGVSANGAFILAAGAMGGGVVDLFHFALRWSADAGYTIINEGQRRFTPRAVSDDGLVVVGDGHVGLVDSTENRAALIWTPEHGVRPLKDALIELGINPAPFTLLAASDISADGRVIVGTVEDINGNRRGFRATLWDLPPRKIIVNSVADRPMLSAANCCDTGEKLPNGEIECTLRAAIEAINAGCGDRIEFAVPDVSIPKISPQTPFPALSVKVDIDGTTQAGGKVEISGTDSTGICLDLQGGSSSVRGLVINNFTGAAGVGIRLFGGGNNVIAGNYIGTDISGNVGAFNLINIVITNSPNNEIGTIKPGEGNVIGDSLVIGGEASTGNTVLANRIGIGADGTSTIGRNIGIAITGAVGVEIGGSSGAGNYLGGFSEIAIGVSRSREIVIEGNFIGLDVAGGRALGGEIGVFVIGSTGSGISNLTVLSNKVAGVRAGIVIVGDKATGVKVHNNFVGPRFDGSGTLPEGVDEDYAKFGIRVDGAPSVDVARNFVAGADMNVLIAGKPQMSYTPCEDPDGDGFCNTAAQILFYSPENQGEDGEFPGVGGVFLGANVIGYNEKFVVPAGAQQRFGIVVYRGARDLLIRNNNIGGHSESDIWLSDGERVQLVQNRIGSGDGTPHNSQIGVMVDQTRDVTIASAGAYIGNTISSQKKIGILVREGATNLVIRQNQIGTGPGGAAAWPNGNGIIAAGVNITGLRIEDNLINASATNAVVLELPGNKAVLQGNRIGVSSVGLPLPNKIGIVVKNTAIELRGNTIAHNETGIFVSGNEPALIQGGPFYQNGDGDPEAAFSYLDQSIPTPRIFISFKLITPAGKVALGFSGVAPSTSAGDVEIEIYGNRAGEKQGRTPLGRKTVKANEVFEFLLEGEQGSAFDTLPEFSATATQSGRTSMFAPVKPITIEAKPIVTGTTATDISLQWPATLPFSLERGNTPSGPWLPVLTVPMVVDNIASVTIPLEGQAQFFRLVLND